MARKSWHLSRRTLLRGAGAALALPLLDCMLPSPVRAAAGETSGKPPVRLGIVSVTGGTVLESWKPTEPGPLAEMPSILRPLEFAKDDLLVLSGLGQSGKSKGGLNAHQHCAFLHLTAVDQVERKADGSIAAGVSVDQAAASVVGQQTYLPSLEMGLSNHETKYSFSPDGVSVPYEANPRLVFERMFRGRKPQVPNWNEQAAAAGEQTRRSNQGSSLQQSVLDLVSDQAASLKGRLGVDDGRRLDEYLHSVRAIEKRIAFAERRLGQAIADSPELRIPELPPEGQPTYRITKPVMQDPEHHGDYIRLMADLLVLAFQTDTTRVATLAVGSDGAYFPGVVTVGYEQHAHTLQHQGNARRVEDADPIAREGCRQIHAWYTQLFAEMVRRMREIPEGEGTLLDNSIILYTSYMADGGHGRRDYPVLLAGRGGGTLQPGRHIAYEEKTPVANLYVELLNRMGVAADSFGNSHTSDDARYNGRLPGLEG